MKISSRRLFSVVFVSLILYITLVQFIHPSLYGIDGYYHLKMSQVLRTEGLRYGFKWAEASIFKAIYADKDFFFHFILAPFTPLDPESPDSKSGDEWNIELKHKEKPRALGRGLTGFTLFSNPIIGGKVAVVFLNIIFLVTVLLVLRRYLSYRLLTFAILIPFLSAESLVLQLLRPQILAYILLLAWIHFILKKKWLAVLVISFLLTLSHISFVCLLLFVAVIELIRIHFEGRFFSPNFIAVLGGIALAFILHPHGTGVYLLVFGLNAIIVPIYSFLGKLSLGAELYAKSTKYVFLYATSLLLLWFVVVTSAFMCGKKARFVTMAFFAPFSIFLLLSLFMGKFWFSAILFGTFTGMLYLHDLEIERQKGLMRFFLVAVTASLLLFVFLGSKEFYRVITNNAERNSYYEHTARWMKENVPEAEVIFHSSFSDTPYFMYFNPKNCYLTVLDPIYMWFWSKNIYKSYELLVNAGYKYPHKVIKGLFGASYGFVGADKLLFRQIMGSDNFEILYSNPYGSVFKIKE